MQDDQWKELCNWAGLIKQEVENSNGSISIIWHGPRGELVGEYNEYPPQDMNTIFRWMFELFLSLDIGKAHDDLERWIWGILYEQDNPLESLLQIIYRRVRGNIQIGGEQYGLFE